MLKTIVAIFAILHGFVHSILAMVPNPKATEPVFATYFSGFGSWVLPELSHASSQKLATTLAVVATIGFVCAGLALVDIIVPFNWWRVFTVASAGVSLLLLIMYWNIYMIVGVLIDVAFLIIPLFTKWSPG